MECEPRPQRTTKKFHYLSAELRDKRGNILVKANNSYTKSHPWQAFLAKHTCKPDGIYLHAEIHAIIKARNLGVLHRAHSLHVSRYLANGKPALAKPCPICEKAIQWAKIKNVYFTCDEYDD